MDGPGDAAGTPSTEDPSVAAAVDAASSNGDDGERTDALAQEEAAAPPRKAHVARSGVTALTLGALGIVFGDIGTSPLYTMKEVFAGPHALAPNETSVLGVLSLVVWALTIIVSVKYITFIMRADNDGEGGIMALIALVQRTRMDSPQAKLALVALGIFGAALFYGDGMITPAISVLSAVEGLEVATPSLDSFVVPITVVVLAALFAIQRFGTGAVGALFGPVMCVWFAVLAVFGLAEVAQSPTILRALSPTYAAAFFADAPGTAFLALGSVVLAVTGAEALYADMGHFGRPAIRRAWYLLVFPALLLNYFGQGAMVLDDPSTRFNPFYELTPDWALYPTIGLATLAAIIASQAVISGAFSVTRQAVQLGFLPRVEILHTSSREIGQIYVSVVNWALLAGVMALVIGFGSSTNLASAYGIAVTGTLAIDTLLFFVVVRLLWRKPWWIVIGGAAAFLTVDLAFFTANIPKIVHGGWFPLVIAGVVFLVLMTWRAGRIRVQRAVQETEVSMPTFLAQVREMQPVRVPGTAVFLTASGDGAPRALMHNLDHNRVLHEHVVLFTAGTRGVPHVPDDERLEIEEVGPGIVRVTAHYGFQDEPRIPAALRLARAQGLDLDVDRASYFLSHMTLLPGPHPGMATWRKRLYVLMSRNSRNAALYFGLPSDHVVEIGGHIEL